MKLRAIPRRKLPPFQPGTTLHKQIPPRRIPQDATEVQVRCQWTEDDGDGPEHDLDAVFFVTPSGAVCGCEVLALDCQRPDNRAELEAMLVTECADCVGVFHVVEDAALARGIVEFSARDK